MSLEIDITHRRGAHQIALSVTLGPGLTALFGPSGAGKTTVLNAVAGLLRPDAGRITLNGRALFDSANGVNLRPEKRRIAVVFQEPRLFPHLSVAANLTYGAKTRDELPAMAELLGLTPLLTRRPATLSGGEAQRVALGRALLSAPDLLLMDEPLSALDHARKDELLPYFERLRDEARLPILYVSHDRDEVARLADSVILLEAGRPVAIGPVGEVFTGQTQSARLPRGLASAVLQVKITTHSAEDDLTKVQLGSTPLWLPGQIGHPGETLRLSLDARDVILARTAPEGLSALNILPVEITAITEAPGSGAIISLDHAGHALVAQITRRSQRQLALHPGQSLFAVIKSMSATRNR